MPQGHRSGSTSDESVPYAELGARRKEALAAEPGRGHREPAARGANEVLRRRERGIRAADRAGFSNDASFDDELAHRGVACWTVDDLATALRAQIGPNELIPPSPSVARLWERDHGGRTQRRVVVPLVDESLFVEGVTICETLDEARAAIATRSRRYVAAAGRWLCRAHSNNGKTALVTHFMHRHPPQMIAPPVPDERRLYRTILAQAYAPFRPSYNAAQLQDQALRSSQPATSRCSSLTRFTTCACRSDATPARLPQRHQVLGSELQIPIVVRRDA